MRATFGANKDATKQTYPAELRRKGRHKQGKQGAGWDMKRADRKSTNWIAISEIAEITSMTERWPRDMICNENRAELQTLIMSPPT